MSHNPRQSHSPVSQRGFHSEAKELQFEQGDREIVNSCNDILIDPDPFSVFLTIAGFLGSVASLAGYIEFKKQLREQNSETYFKNLNEARDLLMTMEVDTMQIETSLRKLELILERGTSDQRTLHLAALQFQFGTAKPIFTLQGFNKYDEILLEINRMVGRSFETISKLLQRLYNLNVQFGSDTYEGLIDLQNRLNAVLHAQVTYSDAFRLYYEIIVFSKDLLRRVRVQLSDRLYA